MSSLPQKPIGIRSARETGRTRPLACNGHDRGSPPVTVTIPTGHSVPFNHSLHTWRDTPYPDVITVASHTKKDNPAGLPSKPSSPATAPGRPYILTRNAGGHAESPSAQTFDGPFEDLPSTCGGPDASRCSGREVKYRCHQRFHTRQLALRHISRIRGERAGAAHSGRRLTSRVARVPPTCPASELWWGLMSAGGAHRKAKAYLPVNSQLGAGHDRGRGQVDPLDHHRMRRVARAHRRNRFLPSHARLAGEAWAA